MSTKTITAIEAHERVAAAAATPFTETRVVREIAIGEHCRQGDVYLERIAKRSTNWKETTNRQLAPGTSQGSRHVVTTGPKVYACPVGETTRRVSRGRVLLLGPQIVAKEPFTVEHPEHAHMTLPPGTYQVSYQLDYVQQRAVRD